MKSKKWLSRALYVCQAMILFIGVYSSIMCTIDQLTLPVDRLTILLTYLLFSILFGYGYRFLDNYPRGGYLGVIIVTIVGGVFFIRFYSVVIRGGTYVINAFLKKYMEYSDIKLNLLTYSDTTKTLSNNYCVTMFFVLLGILVIAYLGMTFFTKRNAGIYFIFTLPFFIIPMLVGTVGSYRFVILYFVASVAVIGTGLFRSDKEEERIRQKISLFMIGVGCVIAFLAVFFCTPMRFNIMEPELMRKQQIAVKVTSWSTEDIFAWIKAQFSADTMDYGSRLGKRGQIVYTGKKLMEISNSSSWSNDLYLRAYIGQRYIGNQWTGYDEESKYMADKKDLFFARNYLDNGGLDDRHTYKTWNKIKIKNIAFGKENVAVPYYSFSLFEQNPDGRVIGDFNGVEYTVPYYPEIPTTFHKMIEDPTPNENLEEWIKVGWFASLYGFTEDNQQDRDIAKAEDEIKLVDQFVKTYDMQLPKDFAEKALPDFYEKMDTTKEQVATYSPERKVKMVRSYLVSNTNYTLSPGETPEGEDFVLYFLQKNKKGYCVHYASAATLLIRALGVPARYVEGIHMTYSDQLEGVGANEPVSVKDSDAHAWVEAYFTGIGFVPIEVTKGVTQNFSHDEYDPANAKEGGKNTNTPNKTAKPSPSPSPDTLKEEPDDSEAEDDYSKEMEEEQMEFEDLDNNDDPPENESGTGKSSGGKSTGSPTENPAVRWIVYLILGVLAIQVQMLVRRAMYKKRLMSAKGIFHIRYRYGHMKSVMKQKGVSYEGYGDEEYAAILSEKLKLPMEEMLQYSQILLKASFSEKVTEDEVRIFDRASRHIVRRIRKNSFFLKRILYRYVFNFD